MEIAISTLTSFTICAVFAKFSRNVTASKRAHLKHFGMHIRESSKKELSDQSVVALGPFIPQFLDRVSGIAYTKCFAESRRNCCERLGCRV